METRNPSELRANPLNPRGEVVHDVSLRELAMSIKSQGVLQPVLITPDGLIVAGHRRVEAAKLADLSEVPVIVRALTETEQLQVMLVENVQRNDLTILQTAKAYKELTQRGLSVDLIAQAIGVTKRSVSEHLMTFKLPQAVCEHLKNGALGLRTVPILLEVDDPAVQIEITQTAVEKGWGHFKIKSAIYRLKNPKPPVEIIPALLDRILERIENGCFTPESINKCDECGSQLFPSLTLEEISQHVDELVRRGRCTLTPQGGKKENQRGSMNTLCMPVNHKPTEQTFRGAVNMFQRQPKQPTRLSK